MTQEQLSPKASTEEATKRTETDRSFTIRVPKLSTMSIQSVFLALLIIFSLIQTVELFAVRSASASIKVTPSASGSSAAPSSNASLPEMVGGC